jgi:hypothetical protein
MTSVVSTTYRYKRPPKKRKAVALDVPVVVRKRGRADAAVPPVSRDSSDGRSATLADGRSDWPTVGLAQPSV